MSCTTTHWAIWPILFLLVAVAVSWIWMELAMWKRCIEARHCAEIRVYVDLAAAALTELERLGRTELKPVKGGWVRCIKDPE